ncbi:MAG: sugar transferase [Pseudomonadota bacterium]
MFEKTAPASPQEDDDARISNEYAIEVAVEAVSCDYSSSRRVYVAVGKRTLDLLLACAMLLAFWPLFLLIIVALRLRGVRSPIYRHQRVGFNGRPFNCLKFRTMVENAEARLDEILREDPVAREEWRVYRKLSSDARIIPGIGKALRVTSLDELPQLFNVLAGDMSIVGPRPVTSEELAHYQSNVGYYLSVKPGLTGPWQIGGRSDSTFEERVSKDVWYVKNISFHTDVDLVLRTAASLLSGSLTGAR